jgi:hypothetical protein
MLNDELIFMGRGASQKERIVGVVHFWEIGSSIPFGFYHF